MHHHRHTAVSFSSLPNDCKIHSFSFLPPKDLNSAAICHKDYLAVQNNETLDQQRTGTLIWPDNTRPLSFLDKLLLVQGKFTGNMTCLKIKILERSISEPESRGRSWYRSYYWVRLCLEEVTSLKFATTAMFSMPRLFAVLASALRNLQELDLSAMTGPLPGIVGRFGERCPQPLVQNYLEWHSSLYTIWYCGHCFVNNCPNVMHLYLDGVLFTRLVLVDGIRSVEGPDLLMKFKHLECLGLKGTTCYEEDPPEPQPLPQDDLIKMVRLHPTLRWLRSDLTAENVAMLKT